MGLWRFGNGRIGRKRGDTEVPSRSSLFASTSGSEEKSDSVESLVTRPRLPESDEDELEIEYDLLATGRCSKTPSPKF